MFKVIVLTMCFLLLTVSNIGARSQYYKAEFCDVGFDVPQVLDPIDKHKSILNEFNIKISVYTFVSKGYKICARLSRNNNIYAYLVCDHYLRPLMMRGNVSCKYYLVDRDGDGVFRYKVYIRDLIHPLKPPDWTTGRRL